mmetsp:Transcript_11606/g.17547  ORF Transcript_11606/g.17547 Transcript_11606/m.17547 type:complete len:118 (+) Transcript_11606:233-586(+)
MHEKINSKCLRRDKVGADTTCGEGTLLERLDGIWLDAKQSTWHMEIISLSDMFRITVFWCFAGENIEYTKCNWQYRGDALVEGMLKIIIVDISLRTVYGSGGSSSLCIGDCYRSKRW